MLVRIVKDVSEVWYGMVKVCVCVCAHVSVRYISEVC